MRPVIQLMTLVLDPGKTQLDMSPLFKLFPKEYITISSIQCSWRVDDQNIVQRAAPTQRVRFELNSEIVANVEFADETINYQLPGEPGTGPTISIDIGVNYHSDMPMVWDMVQTETIEQKHPGLLRPFHLITGERLGTQKDFDLERVEGEAEMVAFDTLVGVPGSRDYIRAKDARYARRITNVFNNSQEWAETIYPKFFYDYGTGKHTRRIVAAANDYGIQQAGGIMRRIIIIGARHYSPAMHATLDMYPEIDKKERSEGFIDQYDKFWDRKMALEIALYSDQLIMKTGGDDILFSEDLY